MKSFESYFVFANRILVGVLLAAIFVIVFVNVVMRYGFGSSISWVEETARYLMVALTYLGAGLALREGRLVAIDFFTEMLPLRARLVVRYIVAALMIVFMIGVVWVGIRFAAFGLNKETMATQMPRAIPYSAIPIGAAVFVVHALLFIKRFAHSEFLYEGQEGQAAANGGAE